MPEKQNERLILGFVSDLMSQAPIESTALSLGYEIKWMDSPEQIKGAHPKTTSHPINSSSNEDNTDLIDLITLLRPIMIIINLGNDQFPWKEWITLIKTSPATRRIPILGFGSHVAAEQFDSALDSGADAVFPRSHFFSHLSKILLEYARTIDMDQILASCQEPLSQKAIAGLDLFNKGEFFEAHEFLELAWKDDRSNGRDLYRAILQVAVAYLQIARGNYRGSIKMFLRVRQWINPLPEICRGVDIGQLRLDAEIVYQQLVKLGANHIDEFDRSLFHPIIYDVSR